MGAYLLFSVPSTRSPHEHAPQTANSKGQSPCLVAAKLYASPACVNSDISLNTLPNGTLYPNAFKPAGCSCSMPIYSLMSACGAAQPQGAGYVNWGEWTKDCGGKTFRDHQGEVPGDTEIPGWAKLDVTVC
jgi:hypothetical protein